MPSRKRSSRNRRKAPRRRQLIVSPGNQPSGITTKYRLLRSFNIGSTGITAGTTFLGNFSFLTSNIPASLSNFFLVWDLFRINSIRVRFVPRWNVNSVNAVADEGLPQIATVVNYDDFAVPSSYNAILQQGNAKVQIFKSVVSVMTRPHALIAPYVSSGSSFFSGLLPADMLFNTNYITGANFGFPLVKMGVTSPAGGVPGGGIFDTYFDVDIQLFQHLA